jgi:hypothetical protein
MNDFSDDATTSFYLVDENDKKWKRQNDEGRILKRQNDEGRILKRQNDEGRNDESWMIKRPRLSGSGNYILFKVVIVQSLRLLKLIFFVTYLSL